MKGSIHVETYGDGDREIVICNGLSQSTANWRGIARQNPGLRWILYDVRGHGKSSVGPTPYSLDGHVDDLIQVLDAHSKGKPFLMGFSHGARIALRASATHGLRFRGLILVSCGAERTPRRLAYLRSWERCLHLGGVEALAWASLPAIVGRKVLEKFPDLGLLVKGTVSRNQAQGLKATFAAMEDYPPVREDALRVTLPTLILRGAEDPVVDEEDLRQLGSWIPEAMLEVFPYCGHTLPLEEPESFFETLISFMDRTLANPP